MQEAECRLYPITHEEGQPTLPPALRVDPAALVLSGRKRIKPSLTCERCTLLALVAAKRLQDFAARSEKQHVRPSQPACLTKYTHL